MEWLEDSYHNIMCALDNFFYQRFFYLIFIIEKNATTQLEKNECFVMTISLKKKKNTFGLIWWEYSTLVFHTCIPHSLDLWKWCVNIRRSLVLYPEQLTFWGDGLQKSVGDTASAFKAGSRGVMVTVEIYGNDDPSSNDRECCLHFI